MRFYISPFGYVPSKYILAALFALIVFLILFYRVIIGLVIVGSFGLAGWWLGVLLDDPVFVNRMKFKIKSVFSRKT